MKMLERYYDEITAGMMDAERANLQTINITEAAIWFWNKESWSSGDFPIVVPPFVWTWMEFQVIQSMGELIAKSQWKAKNIGCKAYCFRLDNETDRDAAISGDALIRLLYDADKNQKYPEQEREEKIKAVLARGVDAGWFAVWNLYFSDESSLMRIGQISATIDTNGEIIPEMMLFQSDLPPDDDDFDFTINMMLGTFLFATSLMHAKNVSLVDDPLPAPIAKRRAREGKPVITFKTLSIEPMRKQSRSEAPGTSGAKRAMHIVRGHFKDYRDGGGLFGKMKGLYWWDMHVAGDAAVGTVVKDYKIGKVKP